MRLERAAKPRQPVFVFTLAALSLDILGMSIANVGENILGFLVTGFFIVLFFN